MKIFAYTVLFLSLVFVLSFNPLTSSGVEIRVQIYDAPKQEMRVKRIRRKRKPRPKKRPSSVNPTLKSDPHVSDTGVIDFMREEEYRIGIELMNMKRSSRKMSEDSEELKAKLKKYLELKSRRINLSSNVE